MAQNTAPFPYPTTPLYINSEQAQIEYLAEHFWDECDIDNITSRYTSNTLAEALGRWGQLLHLLTGYGPTHPIAESAITNLLNKAAKSGKDNYWFFLEWLEKLFYDPSSPLRCDEHFAIVCNHATSSKKSPLDSTEALRYNSLLQLVSRNNPSSTAANFTYTLADGSQHKMHAIEAELLIIYFYNPGCDDCRYVKALMDSSEAIDRLHRQGRLKVLALYPDGEVDEWRKHLHENPSWWISSYDKGSQILQKQTYDLKATPTLYLLDRNKQVILKDPDAERLIRFLDNNF